jgi:hypothetical protein
VPDGAGRFANLQNAGTHHQSLHRGSLLFKGPDIRPVLLLCAKTQRFVKRDGHQESKGVDRKTKHHPIISRLELP